MVARRDWRKINRFLAGEWPKPVPPCHVYTIDTDRLDRWFNAAHQAPYIVIDTEYNPNTLYLTLIGLGYPGMEEALQIEWATVWSDRRKAVVQHLYSLVRRVRVVFQNSLADIPVIEKACGISYEDYQAIDDTMLAHAVLWSEWPHTLEFLASIYGEHPKMKHLAHVDPLLYNLGDVLDTMSVWEGLLVELADDPQSERIYRDQSLPLIPLILERRKYGIRVNVARVAPAVVAYQERAEDAVRMATAYCGYPINLGSSPQLGAYLYDMEGLPEQRNRSTTRGLPGSRTVDDEAIAKLRAKVGEGEHPLIEARIAYAAAKQIASHYLEPMDGVERIYPSIKIHAQASGRWSITGPPLQQLPKDLEDLIIPDEGEVWVEWDWKHAEPRFLAYLAGDLPMIEALEAGADPYAFFARDIFVGVLEPTSAMRSFAKRYSLKLSYGGLPSSDTPGALAAGLTKLQLAQAGARFLARRPALASYWKSIDEAVKGRRDAAFVISRAYDGRRRMITGSKDEVQREAKNHPMQGSVSGLLNETCIAIKKALPYSSLVKTKHDSGTYAMPVEQLDEGLPLVRAIVEREIDVGGFRARFPAEYVVIYSSGKREAV